MSITTVNPGTAVTAPVVGQPARSQEKAVVTGIENAFGAASASSQSAGLGEAVAKMQDYAQSVRRNLDFQLDDSTGRVVVQVINSDSGEVIRQIPSEEVLELASRLEDARSLLLQEKA